MNLLSIDWSELSLQVVITFGHFLWQACVVGLMLVAIDRAVSFRLANDVNRKLGANSNFRYVAACVAFFSLPLCVAATFLWVHQTRGPILVASSDSDVSPAPSVEPMPSPKVIDLGPVLASGTVPERATPDTTGVELRDTLNDNESEVAASRQTFAQWVRALAPWLCLVYLAGFAGMLARIGLSLYGGTRLRRMVQPITDANVQEIVAAQATRLGLRRTPLVAICQRISVPAVIGFLNPTILLPPALLCGLDPHQLAAILSHELAHIRRYDLLVNLLQRVVEAFLFFHPVTWWISRHIRIERENCCDDLAVAGCGRLEFASALLQMAELSAKSRGLNLAPQLEALAADGGNSSQLRLRVKRLLGEESSPRISLTRSGIVAIALAVGVGSLSMVALAQSGTPDDKNPQPSQPNDGIEIRVADAETGLPVSGGVANIRFTLNGWAEKTEDKLISQVQTDVTKDGKLTIAIPDELIGKHSYLQVAIKHSDYVIEQSFGSWSVTPEMSTNTALAQEKLFGGGVIKLKRGHEISGQVLEPDGKPAQDVKLYAAMQMPEYLNMPPHAVTDKEGRFKFRVPSHDGYRLFVISSDFVSVSIPIRKEYGEHPPIKLESGTVINGQVFDTDGNPLADVVVQGNGSDTVYTGFPNPMSRVSTDADGRYSLPPMNLPVDVRVAPLGYVGGWSLRGRDLTGDLAFLPILFKLSPNGPLSNATFDFHPAETVTLTARIFDEKGQPATSCDLAIFGTVPDEQRTEDQRGPFWRGRFSEVLEKPGLFQVKAPKGLLNATLVDAEIPAGPRQKWTRAVGEGENVKGPRAETGWNVLDRDDDSILVGEPAPSSGKDSLDSSSSSPVPDSDTSDKESVVNGIRWGEAVEGLRMGIRPSAFAKRSTRFRHGDWIRYDVLLKNESDETIVVPRDPRELVRPVVSGNTINLVGGKTWASFDVPQEQLEKAKLVLAPGTTALLYSAQTQILEDDAKRQRYGPDPLTLQIGQFPVYAGTYLFFTHQDDDANGTNIRLRSANIQIEVLSRARLRIHQLFKKNTADLGESERRVEVLGSEGDQEALTARLGDECLIDEGDIVDVVTKAEEDDPLKYSIVLKTKPSVARRSGSTVSPLTGTNSESVAIGVFLDGELLSSMVLKSPDVRIPTGLTPPYVGVTFAPDHSLKIASGLTQDEAEQVAARIRTILGHPNANGGDNAKTRALMTKAIVLGDQKRLAQTIESEKLNAESFSVMRSLELAVRHNRVDMIDLLVSKGADPNDRFRYPYQMTPLMIAAELGHIEAMKKLIELGANINLLADYTALQRAVIGEQPSAVELLLKHKADPDIPRHDKQTALHFAAKNGNAMCVKLLLEAGADSSARNASGETPLREAERYKHANVVEILTGHTEKPLKKTSAEGMYANRDNREWPKDVLDPADTQRFLEGLRLERAAIGYLAIDQKPWSAWSGQDGRVDLSSLPDGQHWLINEWPLSVVPVERPQKQFLQRQDLRLGTPPQMATNATWRDYPVQLKVETDETGKEFIRVDITNQTDEPLSFSELDLSLSSKGRGILISGYSPLWLEDDLKTVPRIEVAARANGSFRIDWTQWAQRGVWNTHSALPINLPSATLDPPGRIRLNLFGPVFGSKPLELSHPSGLVAMHGKPNSAAAIDAEATAHLQDESTTSARSAPRKRFVSVKPKRIDVASSGSAEILNDGSVQLNESGNWQEFTLCFAAADLPTAIQTKRLEIFPPASSQPRSDKTVMLSDVKPWLKLKSGKTTSLEFVSCKYAGDAEDESTVNCIDWLSDTGWKVPAFSEQNTSHQLVLRFADPIVIDDASELGITIDAGGSAELGTLSRVRISFADATVNEPNTNTANADAAPTTAGTRRVITVNDVPLSFRWCPPGEFLMGSPEDKRSQYGDAYVTQHRVKISRGFWLQETEVTQAQYEMVTGEKPSFWQPLDGRVARALGREHAMDNPVEQVSWTDASSFCQELTKLDGKHRFRLPTEAEWEYACRAGRPECRYGEINDIAWVFENTKVGVEGSFGHRAVGKKLPNAWGLHDMLGNVSEWCSDWFGPPATQLTIDPTGPALGTDRIARGGNCFADPGELRTDGACMAGTRNRDGGPPHDKLRTRGFRIMLADGNNPNASP